MKEGIINLLEKYEDDIMKYTLGSSTDEDDMRYAEVYDNEWEDAKHDIAVTVKELLIYGDAISPVGMAYIVIECWSGVMTFSEGDLGIKGLKKICNKILNEL